MFHPATSSVAWFIRSQRDRFAPQGVPLGDAQRVAMSRYFRPEALDTVRVVEIEAQGEVHVPFVYAAVRRLSSFRLVPLIEWRAITFDNIIVAHEPIGGSLLFHELVHVEQYRQLGIDRFAELYVHGFLRARRYAGIPLEINAEALAQRYAADHVPPFSVEDEVRKWTDRGKYRRRRREPAAPKRKRGPQAA